MTRSLALHLVLIIAVGSVIYSNTFNVPFIWDDERLILNNSFVRDMGSSGSSTEKDEELAKHNRQRFVAMFTFALNHKVHGFRVSGFHVVNLLIHLCNAVFVYALVFMTCKTVFLRGSPMAAYAPHIAFSTSLLFVSHPVQTEAVTYIFQRQTSLATFFYLLSLCLYIKSRLTMSDREAVSHENVAGHAGGMSLWSAFSYPAALIATIAGMFTKEIAVTIPIAITLYEMSFFKEKMSGRIVRLVPFWLTLFVIPLFYIFGLGRDLGSATREFSVVTFGRLEYLFTQFRVIVRYLRLLLLPSHQNVDYDFPLYKSLFEPAVFMSLILIALIIVSGIYLFVRSRTGNRGLRLVSFGIFWFFITISLESSFIPLRLLINEYRIYLPSVGFFMSVSAIVAIAFERVKPSSVRKAVITLFVLIMVGYSCATYQRNALWADEEAFWQETIKESPKKFVPYYNLAMVYMQKGEHEKAFKMIQAFLSLNPSDVLAHRSLGIFYDDVGRFNDAVTEFEAILKINPADDRAHYDLGVAYCRMGRFEDGIAKFRKALEINPSLTDAYNGINMAYEELDRVKNRSLK